MKPLTPTVGETYGRLTITKVLSQRVIGARNQRRWEVRCRCSCGEVVEAIYGNLRGGNTQSCGCLKRERTLEANVTHGASRAGAPEVDRRLWLIWRSMLQRTAEEWRNYVGISVCKAWKTDFAAFRDWALANGYEPGLSIDRIKNSKGYSPSNCRWTTAKEQARNRTTNRMITWLGETKCAADWFDDPRCPVVGPTYYSRIKYGWTPEEAISIPVGRRTSAKQRRTGH
jgi:hypothetical protein